MRPQVKPLATSHSPQPGVFFETIRWTGKITGSHRNHYQEITHRKPLRHHTSPTNIGFLFTSILGAYDLGYLDQKRTGDPIDQHTRTRSTCSNVFRGPLHETGTDTLDPSTLSTHDISLRWIAVNLAASFIVTIQAIHSMPEELIFRWELWQGYLDTLSNLTEILAAMRKPEFRFTGLMISTGKSISFAMKFLGPFHLRPQAW